MVQCICMMGTNGNSVIYLLSYMRKLKKIPNYWYMYMIQYKKFEYLENFSFYMESTITNYHKHT